MTFNDKKQYFENFIKKLLVPIDKRLSQEFKLPKDDKKSAEITASILHEISRFFYTQSKNVRGLKCDTSWGSADYFSEFHRFWEENHKQVLGLRVDEEKCREVAAVLEENYRPFSPSSTVDIRGLTPQQVVDARLLTAIQDFGFGMKTDYYELARRKPELFDAQEISQHPEHIQALLRHLGVSDYQTDKRVEWERRCVGLLNTKYDGTAFNIAEVHGYSAPEIKKVLVDTTIGIDEKKADMFLRDMQELGIWKLKSFEEVGVASDMNTMRVALRTGILRTRIPLLSSFMDIFCYQYGAVAEATERAWRKVWEAWREIPGNHSVSSPAYLDYLIYNIGRRCCRKTIRRCEERCTSQRRRKCIINRLALIHDCRGWCIFNEVCKEENKRLQPPKSISIFGRYGWTTAYTDEGGGLGLRCSR